MTLGPDSWVLVLSAQPYNNQRRHSAWTLRMRREFARASSRPRWFCEVHHVPALVSLVTSGLGVGVVPRMALPPAEKDRPSAVPRVGPRVSRTLGLVYCRGRALRAAAQLLYDMLVDSKTPTKGTGFANKRALTGNYSV